MKSQLVFLIGLFVLLGMGCTAVPEATPTHTPEPIAVDVVTVPARPSPTVTKIVATETAVAEPTQPQPTRLKSTKTPSTPRPISSPTPSPTLYRPTATSRSTSTATPAKFQPSNGVVEVVRLDDSRHLEWSPTQHQFAYKTDCFIQDEPTISFVNIENMQFVDITPHEGLECYTPNITWHPSGEYLLINAAFNDVERWGEIHEWKIDASSLAVEDLGRSSYIWGWLNDEIYIYQRRVGSGINMIGMYNVALGKGMGSSSGFDGSVMAASETYTVLYAPAPYGNLVAILAQEEISPEYEGYLHGTYIKFVSREIELGEWKGSAPTSFMDVLPNTDEILVLSWQPTEELWNLDYEALIEGTMQSDLYLWNPTIDELSLLIPNGIYGRFSPNGKYLMYWISTPDSPQLHLLNYENKEILTSDLAYADTDYFSDVWGQVLAYTSFSPNGRFLTFYSPEQELMLYDLENGEFLPAITAVPFTPIWSPDNTRFVYENVNNGFSIYEVETQTTYPLAVSGGERLSNPQWSFDGTYLSVVVNQEDGEAKTAVLQLPAPKQANP